jgi:hypothetical protein
MHRISIKEADNFLNEHFKLFLEKKLEEGCTYQIELSPDEPNTADNFFYVKFFDDSGCPKDYKIVLRE